MRNLFSSKYMYLTAAMLTGAAMFTSCSNEDDMGNVNPTYDGESVKTQFAINIPAAKLADTKMTGNNTQQATGAFLGMQNLKLIPLTATAADGMALTQTISLENIAKENTGALDNEQRKIYSNVNIPVGTTNFLFYGEALGTTEAATTTDAFAQGVLKNTITESASTNDINFELLPVTTNTQYNTEATTKKNEILTAVNNVAGAKVDETNTWKKYATDNSTKILAKLYQQFTDFPAGSAASVKLALKDLQSSIASLLGSADDAEKKMAEAINTAIEAAIGADGNGGTLASNTYPTDYNLPVGAAQFSWNDGVASYKEDDASLGETNTVSLDLDKICYPAALSYFVSTDLKATNNSNPQWPEFTDWNGGTWNGVWNAIKVTATTQAVALTKPIQYGVALMETAVKCKTQTLKDNAKAEGGEPNDRIIIVPDDGFPVTGLLIGAQPDALKWNFKPTSDGDRNMTIYDNDVNIVAKYNDASSKNYTLVLENTKTTGNDKVNVAIEMTNNSDGDFYGKDGIIKAGATFYLVGQLDMDNLGTGNNDSGRTSVFEQDYKTVATFTISSLKNAYNCIPDLRATQLSLGLAVDLEWKTGIIFDVTIE